MDISNYGFSRNYLRSILSVFAILLVLTFAFLVQRYVRVSLRDLHFDWMLEIRRNSFVILSLGLFAPLVFLLREKFPLIHPRLNWNFLAHFFFGIMFAFAHMWFVSIVSGGSRAFVFSQKVFLNFFHLEVLSYWLILVIAQLTYRSKNKENDVNQDEALLIKANGVPVRLAYQDIIKIQAYDHYLKIFAKSGTYVHRHSMNGIESRLDSHGFIRVHRSWVINSEFITAIQQNTGQLVLTDGSRLPISRTYKNLVENKLKDFAKKTGH